MKTHNLKFEEADMRRFEEIKSGSKKIETRAANELYSLIEEGDEITFSCGHAQPFVKKVVKMYRWPTIEAMLAEVPLEEVMPGLSTVEEVRGRYASYSGYIERIEREGILGFRLV